MKKTLLALLTVLGLAVLAYAQTPTLVGRFTYLIATTSGNVLSLPSVAETLLGTSTICTTAGWCKGTVTLTDAQIKALPTTPITAIAAPGANKLIALTRGFAYLDTAAAAYTNINAAAFSYLQYAGTPVQAFSYLANDATLTPARAYITATFGAGAKNWWPMLPYVDTVETNQWGNLSVPNLQSQTVNAALQLAFDNGGSGALTGGNAANSLKIVLYFSVEDVP